MRLIVCTQRIIALSCLIIWTGCSMVPQPHNPLDDRLPNAQFTSLINELQSDSTYLQVSGWSLGSPLELAPVIEEERVKLGLERSPLVDLKLILTALFEPVVQSEVNESVWCQHFTLIRLLRRAAHDRSIHLPKSPQCPAFETWMRADQLRGIEVILATPNASKPVSSFGHTMIRLRHAQSKHILSDDLVYELIALTSPHVSTWSYLMRGLFGGYTLIFKPTPLKEVSLTNRSTENRDLVRYDLRLNQRELRHVLQRLWELERRAYLPYYFLNKNCAYYLYWFVHTALFDRSDISSYEEILAPPK